MEGADRLLAEQTRLPGPDGTRARFEGTAEDLKQPLLYVTILVWANILLGRLFKESVFIQLGLSVAFLLANAWVGYLMTTTVVSRLVTSHGSRLNFRSALDEYLRWQLFVAAPSLASGLLIGLLAPTGMLGKLMSAIVALTAMVISFVVLSLFYQWMVSRVAGGSRQAVFKAGPLAYVVATILTVIGCCTIIGIPWVLLYFSKWMAEQVELPVRAAAPNFGAAAGGPGYGFGAPAAG